jgi:hypothetical protein
MSLEPHIDSIVSPLEAAELFLEIHISRSC